jgi:transglutaminase-like putative cysteine protease
MDAEQILKEAQEIDRELQAGKLKKRDTRAPVIAIAAITLSFLIILMVVPYYGIAADPNPRMILTIDEALPPGDIPKLHPKQSRHYPDMIDVTPFVKQVATKIAAAGCDSSAVCQAKAQYLFVRDMFTYVSEQDEYLMTPEEMMFTKGGDCDDHAILLANLLNAIGIPARIAVVPGHAYVEAYLPEASRRYKDEIGWVKLDATCKSCRFGEMKVRTENKRYVTFT